jgi:hypothetical protein
MRKSTRHCGQLLAYCTCPGWLWGWRIWWNEMWLAGETEVFGETLPQRHFVHHKSHLPDLGANPGCSGGKPATNRLSYGAAQITDFLQDYRLGQWNPFDKIWNTFFRKYFNAPIVSIWTFKFLGNSNYIMYQLIVSQRDTQPVNIKKFSIVCNNINKYKTLNLWQLQKICNSHAHKHKVQDIQHHWI